MVKHSRQDDSSMLVFGIIWLLCLLKEGLSSTNYCGGSVVTVNITNETVTGLINSNYPNEVHYGNDRHCVWLVNGVLGSRVQLEVKQSDIQWAPQDVAICVGGYDYMSVDNVFPNSSTSSIVTWCGRRNPGSIISSSNSVRIIFHTNHQNVYKYLGIQLEYRSFKDCPRDWTEFDGHCYFLHPAKLTWIEAQTHCGYSQSNLVIIDSQAERDFVLVMIQGLENTWIGLNDIKKESSYQWIDGSSPSYTSWSSGHTARSDRDCVSMATNGIWKDERCDELDERRFVCEMMKGNVTQVYSIPVASTDKGKEIEIPHWFQWQVLVICLVLLLVIAIIITGICVWKRKRERRKRNSNPYENAAADFSSPSRISSVSGRNMTTQRQQNPLPLQPRTLQNTALSSGSRSERQHSPPQRPPPPQGSMHSPPSYNEATQDDSYASGSDQGGTHVHVHVHMPNVKSTHL